MRRCGYLSVSPRVSPAEDAPDAVAMVMLSGPNGGTVGTGLIDAENARILLRDLAMITAGTPDGEAVDGIPLGVRLAIETCAEWASRCAMEAHPEYEHHDTLKTWIAGAIEAQMTDPDYEQAADMQANREDD